MLQLFYQKSLCILSCQIVENIFPFSGINLNLQRPTSSTLNVDPHMGLGSQATCFAKCHSPIGPRVASWLVVIESDSGLEV